MYRDLMGVIRAIRLPFLQKSSDFLSKKPFLMSTKKNAKPAAKKSATAKNSLWRKPSSKKVATHKPTSVKKVAKKKTSKKKVNTKKVVVKKKVSTKKVTPKKKASTKKTPSKKTAQKIATKKTPSKKAPSKKSTLAKTPKNNVSAQKAMGEKPQKSSKIAKPPKEVLYQVSRMISPPSPKRINPAFVHYISIFEEPVSINLTETSQAPSQNHPQEVRAPETVTQTKSLEPALSAPPEDPPKTQDAPTVVNEPIEKEEPIPTPPKTSMPQSKPETSLPQDDVEAINRLGQKYQAFKEELSRTIIGQEEVIENLAICLFARGHGLLMGVPGLAKTLLVSSVAETLDLSFNRIQFTPDLMPSDISGTDIIQENQTDGRREFEFVKGPVFSNIVLADEINRAPAKTQSAMLEAMQERRVTVLGRTYELDAPFFVLATQNPVEQEGTYPLPEAQLDRFMFLIEVDYPTASEEKRIARETTGADKPPLKALLSGKDVLEFQSLVRRVPVPDHIYDYAVEIVRRTRPDSPEAPDWIKEYVGWGAGPRAVQYLILGCKARAALRGTYMASLDDIEAVAQPVLSHRVLTNFAAESQGMTSKKIVARLVEEMRDEL
jgi:MoxR-like ATPase